MSSTVIEPGTPFAVEDGGSRCIALHDDGTRRVLNGTPEEIHAALNNADEIVWFDLLKPGAAELERIGETFNVHPMALEDARLRHERPKLVQYDDLMSLVVHNVMLDRADDLIIDEIAILAGKDFVVTIRTRPGLDVEEIEHRWTAEREQLPPKSSALLYVILDTIIDGYAPVADSYDEAIYTLEKTVFDDRDPKGTLRDVLAIKRELQRFRRSAVPLRDMLLRYMRYEGAGQLPKALQVYYRDLVDHTQRVIEQIDSARLQLRGTLDVHFNWQTQRQNDVLKQLTIIATIFLPLTYMTGFFGQNFEWMVDNIKGPEHFWLIGVLPEAIAVCGMLIWFRRNRIV